jgi:hypothetical protein
MLSTSTAFSIKNSSIDFAMIINFANFAMNKNESLFNDWFAGISDKLEARISQINHPKTEHKDSRLPPEVLRQMQKHFIFTTTDKVEQNISIILKKSLLRPN